MSRRSYEEWDDDDEKQDADDDIVGVLVAKGSVDAECVDVERGADIAVDADADAGADENKDSDPDNPN